MWDYVYYSFYLDSIDTSNHTALQKHVYELVTRTNQVVIEHIYLLWSIGGW